MAGDSRVDVTIAVDDHASNQLVQAQIDVAHLELISRGYRDIEEIDGLTVGSRVRHRGEQYSDAIRRGTGVVRVLTEKAPSLWARQYGRRDIELIVESDRPRFSSKLMKVADYHVVLIGACYWCSQQVSSDGRCACSDELCRCGATRHEHLTRQASCDAFTRPS